MENKYDLIIIGSGPAGLTASIYAGRARLNTLVIGGIVFGGQLMTTTEVENFPGFPTGIMGPELMQNMLKQAERFGSKIIFENANSIILNGNLKTVLTDSGEFEANSIIISTGATPKTLNIPGEKEFWAKGVSSCATCDGAFFKEKVVAVVGGGDSAIEEATFLTRFAKKVYLIHRREEFRASKIMQEKISSNSKIETILNTEIREIIGDEKVKSLKIFNNKQNSESTLEVDGLFLAIGHTPVTSFLPKEIELRENGYIKSDDGVHTSIDGIFVAGDVEDYIYRQAITASGAGCKAAMIAEKFLAEKN